MKFFGYEIIWGGDGFYGLSRGKWIRFKSIEHMEKYIKRPGGKDIRHFEHSGDKLLVTGSSKMESWNWKDE